MVQDGGSDGEPKPTFIGRVLGISTGNVKETRMSWAEADKSPSAFVQDALKVLRGFCRQGCLALHAMQQSVRGRSARPSRCVVSTQVFEAEFVEDDGEEHDDEDEGDEEGSEDLSPVRATRDRAPPPATAHAPSRAPVGAPPPATTGASPRPAAVAGANMGMSHCVSDRW